MSTRPAQRWCTISSVKNGWLVSLSYPNHTSDNSYREDTMFVFTDVGEMGRWVIEHFGGPAALGEEMMKEVRARKDYTPPTPEEIAKALNTPLPEIKPL